MPHQSSSALGNDYNPGNFLWDGEHVTGFIDFARNCFEDPHIGFAKYGLYMSSPVFRLVSPQSTTAAQPVLPAAW